MRFDPKPSRRAMIAGLLLGTGLAGGAAAAAADPPPKRSQAEARYQDHPKDIQSCGLCTLFVAPDGCKVVDGKVSADGWCQLFALAD